MTQWVILHCQWDKEMVMKFYNPLVMFLKNHQKKSCRCWDYQIICHFQNVFPSECVRVENAIRDGNVLSVRSQLIADISTFYYGLASHPQQGDYKRMALLTCEKFPSLKDSDPSKYWVCYDLYFSYFFSRKMII